MKSRLEKKLGDDEESLRKPFSLILSDEVCDIFRTVIQSEIAQKTTALEPTPHRFTGPSK
jgi:hypothetical protein